MNNTTSISNNTQIKCVRFGNHYCLQVGNEIRKRLNQYTLIVYELILSILKYKPYHRTQSKQRVLILET